MPPNWRNDVEISYKLYAVSPNVGGTDTIARLDGCYRQRKIWFEWMTSVELSNIIKVTLLGWTIQSDANPSKPQEELDVLNGTVTAMKRTS